MSIIAFNDDRWFWLQAHICKHEINLPTLSFNFIYLILVRVQKLQFKHYKLKLHIERIQKVWCFYKKLYFLIFLLKTYFKTNCFRRINIHLNNKANMILFDEKSLKSINYGPKMHLLLLLYRFFRINHEISCLQ